MDPAFSLWFALFVFSGSWFAVGFIYGYWQGRNSKIGGLMNLEPIVRLPADR